MVEELVVNVDCYDIDVFVTRVPGGIESRVVVTEFRVGIDVPDPKQVVELIDVHHAVKYETVELLVAIATGNAPPEPTATGFVKRAPDDSDILFLQLLEECRNLVDIVYYTLVFLRGGVDFLAGGILEGFGVVKAGVVAACSHDALIAARIVETCWVPLRVEYGIFAYLPVPGERGNAAHVPQVFGHQQVVFRIPFEPAVFGMAASGKEHIKAANGRIVAAALVKFGNVGLALPGDLIIGIFTGVFRGTPTRRNDFHVAVIVVKILVTDHHAADGLFAKVFG